MSPPQTSPPAFPQIGCRCQSSAQPQRLSRKAVSEHLVRSHAGLGAAPKPLVNGPTGSLPCSTNAVDLQLPLRAFNWSRPGELLGQDKPGWTQCPTSPQDVICAVDGANYLFGVHAPNHMEGKRGKEPFGRWYKQQRLGRENRAVPPVTPGPCRQYPHTVSAGSSRWSSGRACPP